MPHPRRSPHSIHYRLFPSDEARDLLLGAITTVHRYANAYRRPGHVNSYELADLTNDDYSPSRTIAQQLDLYAMTGEPYFLEMANAFKTDMIFWRD